MPRRAAPRRALAPQPRRWRCPTTAARGGAAASAAILWAPPPSPVWGRTFPWVPHRPPAPATSIPPGQRSGPGRTVGTRGMRAPHAPLPPLAPRARARVPAAAAAAAITAAAAAPPPVVAHTATHSPAAYGWWVGMPTQHGVARLGGVLPAGWALRRAVTECCVCVPARRCSTAVGGDPRRAAAAVTRRGWPRCGEGGCGGRACGPRPLAPAVAAPPGPTCCGRRCRRRSSHLRLITSLAGTDNAAPAGPCRTEASRHMDTKK